MNKELKSLTGIRGIAALWVVFLHYCHSVNHNNEWYIVKLFTNGFVAVDIFFLLSAFVMCLAYSEEFKMRISTASYVIFMKKRFARIYPAYFFWVFMFLCFSFIKLDFDYIKIVLNLLLIQNLFWDEAISFIFWSLSSEWILYLMFPFLYYILQKNRNKYGQLFLILVSIIGIYILPFLNIYVFDMDEGFLILPPDNDVGIIFGINSIVRCFFSYVIGINLFLFIKDFNFSNYTWANVFKYVAIIGIFIIAYFGKSAETYVLTLICSIIIILVLYLNRAKEDSFFASKIVYFLGLISYSIYLCHMFIATFASIVAKKFFPLQYDGTMQTYLVLGSLILLIPVSYLSYTFMEVKAGAWLKNKLFPKPSVK